MQRRISDISWPWQSTRVGTLYTRRQLDPGLSNSDVQGVSIAFGSFAHVDPCLPSPIRSIAFWIQSRLDHRELGFSTNVELTVSVVAERNIVSIW
jgi:hypothetical protein